jgi:hypothetical protein
MRTPAVHVASQQLGLFETKPNLDFFLNQRGSCATIPLHNGPIRQGFYQAISKKKLKLCTYAAFNQKR